MQVRLARRLAHSSKLIAHGCSGHKAIRHADFADLAGVAFVGAEDDLHAAQGDGVRRRGFAIPVLIENNTVPVMSKVVEVGSGTPVKLSLSPR
jgi:hypothetical protein